MTLCKDIPYETMTSLEQIADIFSINHDGTITKLENLNNSLSIQIEIEYLASLKNSSYKVLNYELSGYSNFKFVDTCENNKVYTEIKEIEKMELSIFQAKVKGDNVIVGVCSDNCPYGELQFSAKNIKIYDQNYAKIEYNELVNMVKRYWKKWQKK